MDFPSNLTCDDLRQIFDLYIFQINKLKNQNPVNQNLIEYYEKTAFEINIMLRDKQKELLKPFVKKYRSTK